MQFKGEIGQAHDDDPPNTTHFLQWDLGYRRQDPALYGGAWKKLKNRFLDLLGSGQPLTISAEGKSYMLPAVDAADWKKQFTDRADGGCAAPRRDRSGRAINPESTARSCKPCRRRSDRPNGRCAAARR
jgi:hypothetical protein